MSEEEQQPKKDASAPATSSGGDLERNPEVEQFFQRLMDKQDMRRPKPTPEALAAALQAIQRLGTGSGDETDGQTPGIHPVEYPMTPLTSCRQCGHDNQFGNLFCGMCGSHLSESAPSSAAGPFKGKASEGRHHYHHHYHHHYFAAGQDAGLLTGASAPKVPSGGNLPKDAAKVRAPIGGPAVSRAEAALRQMTQDWALACNNKQLDDLLTFYATDALVLRPNLPPVRGTSAIREFFFSALGAGLGDVEMAAVRVELMGDVGYEVGRCKMLVPTAVGKRREERGKYVVVFAKQQNGEWKAVVDTWSSDLNLNVGPEPMAVKAPPAGPLMPPKPRR